MATATIEVNVKPASTFVTGVAGALESFGKLSEAERTALPDAVQAGIDALRHVAEECADGEMLILDHDPAPVCHGHVILEWPAVERKDAARAMAGWQCSIFDAETGKPILTVERAVIAVDVRQFVTCELTMFTDADGNPIRELEPGPRTGTFVMPPADAGGQPLKGTFFFLVDEMRVRGA